MAALNPAFEADLMANLFWYRFADIVDTGKSVPEYFFVSYEKPRAPGLGED